MAEERSTCTRLSIPTFLVPSNHCSSRLLSNATSLEKWGVAVGSCPRGDVACALKPCTTSEGRDQSRLNMRFFVVIRIPHNILYPVMTGVRHPTTRSPPLCTLPPRATPRGPFFRSPPRSRRSLAIRERLRRRGRTCDPGSRTSSLLPCSPTAGRPAPSTLDLPPMYHGRTSAGYVLILSV